MNTQQDSKQELQDSENKQESQKYFWDWEFDRAMQELYDDGYFEPRKLVKLQSGLIIAYLVPPERHYSEHYYSFDP